MNYVQGYINGEYKLEFTDHARQRAVERLQELGIQLDADKCIELAEAGANEALSNKFMLQYLTNMMLHGNNQEVQVYDERNKMVYMIIVDTELMKVVVKTLGSSRKCKWEHTPSNKRLRERKCWIYENAFVFTTINGNVTWI